MQLRKFLSCPGGSAATAAGTSWTGAAGRGRRDLHLLKGEATVIPIQAWAGGTGAAIAIGTIAELMPALRARTALTQAL